jgi:ubiquitin-like protein Pup
MPSQEHKRRSTSRESGTADAESAEASGRAAGQASMEEVDDLLDEIDEVLEQNAEDFVKSYIQKGGE